MRIRELKGYRSQVTGPVTCDLYMIWIIYNILLHLYFIITSPFYLVKFFTSEKYRGGLKARLGLVPRQKGKSRILVHTVSVGEFLASIPLVKAIEKELSEYKLVVSTTTTAGNKVARAEMKQPNKVVYFPLDFNWSVDRFLNRISPALIILVETELWPNFLQASQKRNIPIIVVNGRISNHSFRNYSRLRGFFKYMCKDIGVWGMQFEGDLNRVKGLGIDEEKVYLTGSLKFDSAIQRTPGTEEINRMRSQWGWKPELLVLVGGSTHRGEERILLDIYQKLKDSFIPMKLGLVLILAPRHPERINELKTLVGSYGFKYILKSEWDSSSTLSQYEVVLVDTLGELISVYSLADVVFIGKSLRKGGGQNLLEPASLGKAVVCGPFMQNFQEVTEWLVENGGIVQVSDAAGLMQAIKSLLNRPEERETLGGRARELVLSASGAAERNMELVKKIVQQDERR